MIYALLLPTAMRAINRVEKEYIAICIYCKKHLQITEWRLTKQREERSFLRFESLLRLKYYCVYILFS